MAKQTKQELVKPPRTPEEIYLRLDEMMSDYREMHEKKVTDFQRYVTDPKIRLSEVSQNMIWWGDDLARSCRILQELDTIKDAIYQLEKAYNKENHGNLIDYWLGGVIDILNQAKQKMQEEALAGTDTWADRSSNPLFLATGVYRAEGLYRVHRAVVGWINWIGEMRSQWDRYAEDHPEDAAALIVVRHHELSEK